MNLDHPVIQAIRTRRSVRKYRAESVSREALETIVDCGRLAPSANNVQAWEFVVVTEREKLGRLAVLATHGKFIADAAACIIVCGDPSNRSCTWMALRPPKTCSSHSRARARELLGPGV